MSLFYHARSGRAAVLLLLGLGMSCALGQAQRFRERQIFDPNTGTWIEEDAPPEQAALDQLGEARALIAEGKPGPARDILKKWLKANPGDDQFQDADYLLGETYFLGKDFWKAVERYQSVAENSSGELFNLANGRCIDVARAFLSGQKRILWGIFRLPAQDDGVDILDRVWQRAPGSRLGEVALHLKADYFFGHGDMDLAQDEYANLVKQYPSGRWIQQGMLRSAESAEAAFPGIRFDDKSLIEADERYRQFQSAFPAYAERESVNDRLTGIRETRAEKDLDIARWYERTKRTDAAGYYYRLIVRDYGGTLAESEARARLRVLGADLNAVTTPESQAEEVK
jgi:hypothetical protein